MKRAIIVGATSGIGQEIAKVLLAQGWKIGIAGRRKELLTAFQERNPEQIATQALDVTQKDAVLKLNGLIEQLGGMDLFLLCSGIGKQNRDLQPEIEIDTARTNVGGFIRMTNAAYTYFRQQGGGHLAVISSIAGTKGLGVAPAYSATKRFQNIYMDQVRAHLLELPHVLAVHDLHASAVSSDLPVLSAHVVLADECFHDGHSLEILSEIENCLQNHHGISIFHTTVQLEPASRAQLHRETWH